jgi:hypothetical protein
MKLPFTLIRLGCGVQLLAMGLLGPFSLKKALTWSATMLQSTNSWDPHKEKQIAKAWF